MLVDDIDARIVIGTPSYDGRISDLLLPIIYGMELPPTQFIPIRGGYIDRNRNAIIQQAFSGFYDEALGGKPTHLLMIDSDSIPRSTDAVRKLIEADKDIICGITAFKEFPSDWMVYNWKNREEYAIERLLIAKNRTEPFNIKPEYRGVFEVDAAGHGMVLIKREVFEIMDSPWYQTWADPDLRYYGEDVVFYKHAQDAGFEAYAHGEVLLMHQEGKLLFPDLIHKTFEMVRQSVARRRKDPVK